MGKSKMHIEHQYNVWTNTNIEKLSLKRVLLIVNPNSGGRKGLKILEVVQPLLEAGGCTVRVLRTEYAGHAREMAMKENLDDIDVFAPIGGDGTVHEVVNGFMSRDDYATIRNSITIAIIPGGTGNTLAYDLCVNTPEKAAQLILDGSASLIDCAKVEDLSGKEPPVYSINIVGFGLPSTVLKTANSLRWIGGAQYKLGAYLSLISNKSYAVDVTIVKEDDSEETISGKYVMIQGQCTVHMGDRLPFCPKSKLDNGLMDLVFIRHCGRMKLVKLMTDAEEARHVHADHEDVVSYYQVKSFTINPGEKCVLRGPKTVNVDGELIAASPFRASVVPKCLRFVADVKTVTSTTPPPTEESTPSNETTKPAQAETTTEATTEKQDN